jgi:hypothetical protein
MGRMAYSPSEVQTRRTDRRERAERSPRSRPSYHQMHTAVRVSTWSFSRMCWTCFWMVRELHPRIFPISRFRFPAAIHSTTSSSRFVNAGASTEIGRLTRGFSESRVWGRFRDDMKDSRRQPVHPRPKIVPTKVGNKISKLSTAPNALPARRRGPGRGAVVLATGRFICDEEKTTGAQRTTNFGG